MYFTCAVLLKLTQPFLSFLESTSFAQAVFKPKPMQYHIRLIHSEEGWAVSCPALPGCHSQGATREEAIQNIKSAIREWLEVEAEESGLLGVEEVQVAI